MKETQPEPFLWHYAANTPPSGPLLLWENQAFLGVNPQVSHPARLIALSLTNGRVRWEKQFDHTFVHHLAAAYRQNVPTLYATLNSRDFLHGQATLLAWNAQGQQQWQWQAPGGAQIFSHIAIYNNHLWFSADSNILWHVNPMDEQDIRRFPLNLNVSWEAPLVTQDMVIVPGKSPRLLALSKNGDRRWLYDASAHTAHWLDRTPVLSGDYLVAAFSRGLIVCLDVQTGRERWRVAVGPAGKELSGPACDDRLAYVGARDGLYALSLENGRVAWHYRLARSVMARPRVHEGRVYVAGHDHYIHILTAATGEPLWQSADLGARLEETPILGHQIVVAVNRRGQIAAVKPPLDENDLIREGLWQEAIALLTERGEVRRIAEVREMFDHPLHAAYAWEKLNEWERAAILYEAAGAWEYAAALWHKLDQLDRYAEALLNHAQTASARALGDEEMAVHWEKAALALESTDQRERAADCWRQVARHRRLPILKTTVVPERPLLKGQRTPLTLHIRNEGFGPALFPAVRASGDHFARSKLMSTRHFKQLRDYDEVQETIFVTPTHTGEAIPLRFTVEYLDEQKQNHLYRETVMVTVTEESDQKAGQTFLLNRHESQTTVTPTPNKPLADSDKKGVNIPAPFPGKLETPAELFQYYGLPAQPSVTPSSFASEEMAVPQPTTPHPPLALRIDASAPKTVVVGEPFRLAVALRQPDSPLPDQSVLSQIHSGKLMVSPPQNGDFTRLRLQVSCPGCQPYGPESRTIRYYANQDTPIYSFQLLPTQAGSLSILVSVLQEDDWLGDAHINTIAEVQAGGGQIEFNITSQPVDSAVEIRVLRPDESPAFPVEMRLLDRSVMTEGWLHLHRPDLLKHELNSHQYGQALGKMLFAGELEYSYRQAVSTLETEGHRLHVRLWLDEAELHDIRWERLYQPWKSTWDRLGSNARTPFSRYVVAQNFTRPRPLAARPIRLLVVLASPANIQHYNLPPISAEERTHYKAIWQEMTDLEVTVLESGTPNPPTMNAIRDALIQGQHIVHFVCHGGMGQQGVILYLENEAGQTDLVTAERLLGGVRAAAIPPLLINLTTCESGRTDGFLPLAPRLVAEAGAQVVLAMNGPIQVATARLFTRQFYRRLLEHGLVDLAANEARAQIHDQADWGVPVLFSRLTDNRLLSVNN